MASTPLRTKILATLGYVAFFCVCFIVFAYWSFPYDRLRDYAVQQVAQREAAKRGKQDRYELKIGELGPAFLFGVAASDVEYIRHPAEEGAQPVPIRLDEVEVRPSLLGMLFDSVDVELAIEAGGGSLDGSCSVAPDLTKIDLKLADVDLGQLGLGAYLGVPVTGRATGVIDVLLPSDTVESTGKIELEVERTTLGDGKAKIAVPGMRDGFTLEKVNAGKLDLAINIANGTATLERLSTDGADLVLDGSGLVKLASPVGRSRLNLTLAFKFSDAYKQRDDKTKAVFELMSFRPELKRATTPTGALRFQLSGTVAAPRGRPAGKLAPKRGKTKRSGKRAPPKRPKKK
ncbi:MAG: type II secretion system protein GspN [Myxococcales bacterium]|nr:type II secretion system protein GspN [Myxococcales bacterium]MDD9965282.1 type II secretion system protein GspN [Myxococcales bacterium]